MGEQSAFKRIHAQRLREVYRSAGWPFQDIVEVDLLAAGLLERVTDSNGHELMRVTDTGIRHIASATEGNRNARSAHESLIDRVVEAMVRDGRIVWTGLSLRARVPGETIEDVKWKMCMPDVFSIRNTSRQDYLEPVVHEIKVSRADLLGDLKRPEKRQAYLDVGRQCWYVLGCNAKAKPIGEPDEIPAECGVMLYQNGRLETLRVAPKKPVAGLPFPMWMALAKANPVRRSEAESALQESLKCL
jgi:hypothetical protein